MCSFPLIIRRRLATLRRIRAASCVRGVTWGCPLPLRTHRRSFCFNEFPARSPLSYFRIGVSFEPRWAKGDDDRLPKLAAELVGLKVDPIVTGGANAAVAAKRATSSIPIVMTTSSDPVELGLISSLRQPGGNVTGMTSIQSELAGKRLELVRIRSEEHTSELQSLAYLVCRLLLEKKKKK